MGFLAEKGNTIKSYLPSHRIGLAVYGERDCCRITGIGYSVRVECTERGDHNCRSRHRGRTRGRSGEGSLGGRVAQRRLGHCLSSYASRGKSDSEGRKVRGTISIRSIVPIVIGTLLLVKIVSVVVGLSLFIGRDDG